MVYGTSARETPSQESVPGRSGRRSVWRSRRVQGGEPPEPSVCQREPVAVTHGTHAARTAGSGPAAPHYAPHVAWM